MKVKDLPISVFRIIGKISKFDDYTTDEISDMDVDEFFRIVNSYMEDVEEVKRKVKYL